jgi:hypothetical protein
MLLIAAISDNISILYMKVYIFEAEIYPKKANFQGDGVGEACAWLPPLYMWASNDELSSRYHCQAQQDAESASDPIRVREPKSAMAERMPCRSSLGAWASSEQ